MKRCLLLILLLTSMFILSGCWDNKDINHRVMPVVLGVSQKDENYEVYLQIPQPAGGQIETIVVSGTGKTVNEIVDRISANMERSVDLLHIKVVVVDRELAEKGVKDLISGFIRSRDISSKALFAVIDQDLSTFFGAMTSEPKAEGTILLDFFEKSAGWDPQIALTRIWEVYRSIYSYTNDVAVPLMKLGKTTLVEHTGSAIIKNGVMKGDISAHKTLLYNAFNGESTLGKIEVLDDASVMILGEKMKFKGKLEDDKPVFSLFLKLKVTILETINDPSENEIKKELEQLLTERYQSLFEEMKESESDILGIGQYFRREIPRDQLKEWRSVYFPELKVDFDIEIDIQNTGNLKIPKE